MLALSPSAKYVNSQALISSQEIVFILISMTAVLESHSVARIGVDLNHFVLKILNIDN